MATSLINAVRLVMPEIPEDEFDDDMDVDLERHPVQGVFITEGTVAAARAYQEQHNIEPDEVEFRYGDMIFVETMPDGARHGQVVEQGEDAGLYISLPGRVQVPEAGVATTDVPITSHGMLRFREHVRDLVNDNQTLGQDAMRAFEQINGMVDIVGADPDRFSSGLVAAVFRASMTDSLGNAHLGVSDEDFVLKARVDMLRAAIGALSPEHADSIRSAAPLGDILAGAGIEGYARSGANERASASTSLLNAQMRRSIASNERLVRSVFSPLTSTPISDLAVAALPGEAFDAMIAAHPQEQVTGQWVDLVKGRMDAVLSDVIPGYRFDFALLAIEGRDVMMVRDKLGQGEARSYAYSWPTHERRAYVQLENGEMRTPSQAEFEAMINVSQEEIPSQEEVDRLQGVLNTLQTAAEQMAYGGEDMNDPASGFRRLTMH